MVEDDQTARLAITRILRAQGYAPSEAATLAEATRALARPLHQHPRWILLDLMLPDGNGLDLLRKVRAERLPSRVVVITGCGPSMLADARALGADHLFTKPLDVDRLLDVLASVPQ